MCAPTSTRGRAMWAAARPTHMYPSRVDVGSGCAHPNHTHRFACGLRFPGPDHHSGEQVTLSDTPDAPAPCSFVCAFHDPLVNGTTTDAGSCPLHPRMYRRPTAQKYVPFLTERRPPLPNRQPRANLRIAELGTFGQARFFPRPRSRLSGFPLARRNPVHLPRIPSSPYGDEARAKSGASGPRFFPRPSPRPSRSHCVGLLGFPFGHMSRYSIWTSH